MGDERVDEVRAWIGSMWDPAQSLGEWWGLLADAGFAFPTWPEGLGGRGWSPADGRMVERELAAAGVIGAPSGVGQTMGAPTVVAHGTEEQQARFVPPLAAGAECWCQLFSEPGAGSDLAGLRTRAVRDGDRWIVDGQKVWNSDAHRADRGLLLARTDGDVPKHGGISYFVVDMQQPGVEVRPLRQMNGDTEFDEVFLTDVVVEADRMIGAPGDGWRVAQTTLAYERAGIGSRTSAVAFPAGARAGVLDVPVGELLERAKATSPRGRISGYVISPRVMADLAREHGVSDDPLVRQRLAEFRAMADVNRWTGQRTRAAAKGARNGAEANVSKLAVARMARVSRDLGLSILGPYGMLAGADAPHDGAVQHVALSSPAASLGGGTDEIQRNIIGERGLGLPREPQVDRDVAFRELGGDGA